VLFKSQNKHYVSFHAMSTLNANKCLVNARVTTKSIVYGSIHGWGTKKGKKYLRTF
jgi:hypothetical protein